MIAFLMVPIVPVHPHARGERLLAKLPGATIFGSSPRTWGTLFRDRVRVPVKRFIPTHVGNAKGGLCIWTQRAVHPHARGERDSCTRSTWPANGSSPRTWGTQPGHCKNCPKYRFIPTHVGNAPLSVPRIDHMPVHPHARGERWRGSTGRMYNNGSSPRTWGTRRQSHFSIFYPRFIPTHVGNAQRGRIGGYGLSVHPHARGERDRIPCGFFDCIGSSPRTWGTPVTP